MKIYQGSPYQDERFNAGPQQIPGRVYCAYYDLGGEGIAYHDTTFFNHGSGKLNPADGSYLNEFRMNENVDISYTKPAWDDTVLNKAVPELGMLYVGWTEPGEWLRYTLSVCETGWYRIHFFYSSAREQAAIYLRFDEKEPLIRNVEYTGHPHIWNYIPLLDVHLKKGTHLMTLGTAQMGLMNYGYLDFETLSQEEHTL